MGIRRKSAVNFGHNQEMSKQEAVGRHRETIVQHASKSTTILDHSNDKGRQAGNQYENRKGVQVSQPDFKVLRSCFHPRQCCQHRRGHSGKVVPAGSVHDWLPFSEWPSGGKLSLHSNTPPSFNTRVSADFQTTLRGSCQTFEKLNGWRSGQVNDWAHLDGERRVLN